MERRLKVEQLRYGKRVESIDGSVAGGGEYEVTGHSPGIQDPSALLTRLLGPHQVKEEDIDFDSLEEGALVFRGLEGGGLAAMRLRYRPEDGARGSSRGFTVAQVVTLEGIHSVPEIPVGFFSWCAANLHAEPQVVGEPKILEPSEIWLPKIKIAGLEFGEGRRDLDCFVCYVLSQYSGSVVVKVLREDGVSKFSKLAYELDSIIRIINNHTLEGNDLYGEYRVRPLEDLHILIGAKVRKPDPSILNFSSDSSRIWSQASQPKTNMLAELSRARPKSAPVTPEPPPAPKAKARPSLQDNQGRLIGLSGFSVTTSF